MSSTQTSDERASERPNAGTTETKIEVVVNPVSDVERVERFYVERARR